MTACLVSVKTTEMHTGGEAVRIIESGFPKVEGSNILDKRRYLREHLDRYRKFTMFEPRGHYDMYGALLVPPDIPGADVAVIFMHNEGYSTMCGHAVISLGRYLIDCGIVKNPTSPETTVKIQCPCGMITARTRYVDGHTGDVRFQSVPAFLFAKGGEAVRIIESGFPKVEGSKILDKRRYLREHLDMYKKFTMFEPRGHYDMYGALLVPPDIPGADVAVIFMDNKGYSTMCGHAVISLGRYLIDCGMVKNPTSPETTVKIQCPCGMITARTSYVDGHTGDVRFQSVPAFLFAKDVTVDVAGYGSIMVDISYGGAFYAFLNANALGLDIRKSSIEDLANAADKVTAAVKSMVKLEHPDNDDLAFLYGTILTDGADDFSEDPTTNLCVFADKQVDRSPCGSGTTARIAQQVYNGHIKLGQMRKFTSRTGAIFTAKAVEETTCGKYKAVIVEVCGKGHYTGSCTFTLDDEDEIGKGFLLR